MYQGDKYLNLNSCWTKFLDQYCKLKKCKWNKKKNINKHNCKTIIFAPIGV